MKKNIGTDLALYPTPLVVVGAMVDGKPNYALVGHLGIIGHDHIMISLSDTHYTNKGIRETNVLSVNIVSEAMLKKADYVGTVSGNKTDKSSVFSYQTAETGAPIIDEAPVVMECKVEDIYKTDGFESFICKIIAVHAEESVLNEDERIDYGVLKPVLFEMPTYQYLRIGEIIVFLLLFIAFLVYLFIMSKKGDVQEEGEIKDIPVWKCLLFMIIGGVMVVKGSDFAVSGASWIARFFGMSERFIGLTIVAFGTSLPELVTSVAAARKGNAGIAIGNIVGSNIFNILFVIGITALICNVPFESKFLIDTAIAIFSGALLWLGTYKHKELRKPCGIVMLVCYAAYFVYLCVL